MKKPALVLFLFIGLSFIMCKKDNSNATINVTLYNKPLSVIQSYVVGKWRLQYEHGGFCATCVYPVRNNPFLYLTKDTITIGDDSSGVIVNTKLDWLDVKTLGRSYSGYDLSYYYPLLYGQYSINYLILQIHNDTLQLRDDADDAIFYEYTKFD